MKVQYFFILISVLLQISHSHLSTQMNERELLAGGWSKGTTSTSSLAALKWGMDQKGYSESDWTVTRMLSYETQVVAGKNMKFFVRATKGKDTKAFFVQVYQDLSDNNELSHFAEVNLNQGKFYFLYKITIQRVDISSY